MAPGRSLFKRLRIAAGRRPDTTPWRPELIITARKPAPADPGRRSLCDLSEELILLIIDHLQDISPGSVVVLASANSFLYSKARYVQHRHVTIGIKPSKAANETAYLRYLSSNGLLPAIRTLRYADFVNEPEKYQFPQPLYDPIDRMTGLRDLHWEVHPIPASLLDKLKQRTRVRLHAVIRFITASHPQSRALSLGHIDALSGSPNLYSLRVNVNYVTAEESLETLRPLRGLLLSCPNLRKLSLDVYQPRFGCQRYDLTAEYCGLGLSGGERLPVLEELDVVEYPWGRDSSRFPYGVKGYPGKDEVEEEYWARHCDWSRLRRLAESKGSLAYQIAPQLTALDHVNFASGFHFGFPSIYKHEQQAMIHFFRVIPSILDSIVVPNFESLTAAPIGIAGNKDLMELRDGLPQLQHLTIHIRTVTSGSDWPYDALDIMAGFPRLQSAKLFFSLPTPKSADDVPPPPYLAMASAESLFLYVREHSTADPPPLQRLHLCANPLGNDFRLAGVTNDGDLIRANSASFVCEIRHDDSRRAEVVVACTKLSEELNEKMRRIVRDGEKPSPAEMAKVDFRVALEGPISGSQLKVMRRTDPGQFSPSGDPPRWPDPY